MRLRRYLYKLPLSVKLNLTLYIAAIFFATLLAAFIFVGNSLITQMRQSMDFQKDVYFRIDEIDRGIRKLDFLTFDQIVTNKFHKSQIEFISNRILKDLEFFYRQKLFADHDKIRAALDRIEKRLVGYRQLLASLPEDAKLDPVDGLYGVYGLSKASMMILDELDMLRNLLDRTINAKMQELDEKVVSIRTTMLLTALAFFLLMYYLSRSVADSMLWQFDQLKKQIVSFFDYLTGKSPRMISVRFEANDEISQMAKIINDHLHFAGEIVEREREEAKVIQQRVEEATEEIRKLNREIEATQREILFTMGAVAEERSNETGAHVRRVAEYSFILAKLYGLKREDAILLKSASPMHDIGKIGIPDKILHKPGKLSEEEFEIMKSHTTIGYNMLKHSKRPLLKAAAVIAHEHHEYYNGKGYPRGLKGEEIHIFARITTICDVFDALGMERVYKKAWPLEKIIDFFEEQSGKMFDPEICRLFLDNIEHFMAAKRNIELYGNNKALDVFIDRFDQSVVKLEE